MSSPSDDEFLKEHAELIKNIVNRVADSLVTHGKINAEGKTEEEILIEASLFFLDQDPDEKDIPIYVVQDHSSSLFKNAEKALENGEEEIACALYATYIEHELNFILKVWCERSAMSVENAKVVLREFGTRAKLVLIYSFFGESNPPEELYSKIVRVSEMRNRFLHFKHTASDIDGPLFEKDISEYSQACFDAIWVINELEKFEVRALRGGFPYLVPRR